MAGGLGASELTARVANGRMRAAFYRDGGGVGAGGDEVGGCAGCFIVKADMNSSLLNFPSPFLSAEAKVWATTGVACAS
jgi:hypothetical protein